MSIDRQARTSILGDDRQQLLDPFASLRSRYAELGQMRPQGIDQLGSLPHQQIACPMLHQPALLLGRLDRTNRMVGRRTASQIASASAASFLLRLT